MQTNGKVNECFAVENEMIIIHDQSFLMCVPFQVS